LKTLATRIVSALDVAAASSATVADAKSINNKIQGRRSSAKLKGVKEVQTISISQQSYDSILDNFHKLIDLVASESSYMPNETELQVTSLRAYAGKLQTANTTVINANTVHSNAMISRNNILHANDNGLIDIVLDVKKYVKSVFGVSSPQYKQIGKIAFRKYK
jgi:hypothetical protein